MNTSTAPMVISAGIFMAAYAVWSLVPSRHADTGPHPPGTRPGSAGRHRSRKVPGDHRPNLTAPPRRDRQPTTRSRRKARTRRSRPHPAGGGPRNRRRLAALSAGLASGLFLGGVTGGIAAPCVAVLVDRRLARLPSSADHIRRQRISTDLPMAADLLSACLLAGATPVTAVTTVAAAVGGPLGDELRSAATAVRLGGDPARCWSALAAHPELAPLGRALSRSGDGGAPLAERIAHVADECRERCRSDLTTTARRTAVRATLPLGACFLPAFLVIGVIPVVIGLAAPLLGRT